MPLAQEIWNWSAINMCNVLELKTNTVAELPKGVSQMTFLGPCISFLVTLVAALSTAQASSSTPLSQKNLFLKRSIECSSELYRTALFGDMELAYRRFWAPPFNKVQYYSELKFFSANDILESGTNIFVINRDRLFVVSPEIQQWKIEMKKPYIDRKEIPFELYEVGFDDSNTKLGEMFVINVAIGDISVGLHLKRTPKRNLILLGYEQVTPGAKLRDRFKSSTLSVSELSDDIKTILLEDSKLKVEYFSSSGMAADQLKSLNSCGRRLNSRRNQETRR